MPEKAWLSESSDRSIQELIALQGTHRIDSIVVAIEEALMRKPSVNSVEQVVLAVEAMEREVNNGGFHQFFSSSSSQYASILASALEKITAPKTREIVVLAAIALGAAPDWTSERYAAAAMDADETTLVELSECDAAYFASGEAISDRLFEFIMRHQSDIYIGRGAA